MARKMASLCFGVSWQLQRVTWWTCVTAWASGWGLTAKRFVLKRFKLWRLLCLDKCWNIKLACSGLNWLFPRSTSSILQMALARTIGSTDVRSACAKSSLLKHLCWATARSNSSETTLATRVSIPCNLLLRSSSSWITSMFFWFTVGRRSQDQRTGASPICLHHRHTWTQLRSCWPFAWLILLTWWWR